MFPISKSLSHLQRSSTSKFHPWTHAGGRNVLRLRCLADHVAGTEGQGQIHLPEDGGAPVGTAILQPGPGWPRVAQPVAGRGWIKDDYTIGTCSILFTPRNLRFFLCIPGSRLVFDTVCHIKNHLPDVYMYSIQFTCICMYMYIRYRERR